MAKWSRSCALAAAWMLVATRAPGELFRCVGPDGEPIFTDQKGTCPGAEPFEPSGVVHGATRPSSATPGTTPANPPDPRSLAEEAEAAQAQLWMQKKQQAEQEIAAIQARRDWMRPYVGHCNRGGYVTTRDDAGIQQVVNCTELRREFAALEAKEAAAREYLEVGLPEECRKAGCLPGWLR